MIAGAICADSDCTGLMVVLFVALAAVALFTIMIAVGSALLVEAVLRRRGWSAASRWSAALGASASAVVLAWGCATALPGIGALAALGFAVAVIPLAIQERRAARQEVQSSPCSTA